MKEIILREIKRLAQENGGCAPGKAVFQKATGIAESDWYGKIWLRWNDAVREAGLEPNERQAKFSSQQVLDGYADICRHYGKVPSTAELRFYVRANPDSLGHNTFVNHFGSKGGLIAALRQRAVELDDSDLLKILPKEVADALTADESSPIITEGYVYLLKSGNHYKIGRSDEIEKRIKQITIALPEKVELIHTIRTDDPPGIEAYWHRRFSHQRANGEWFSLSSGDIKAFKRRKFQ